MESTAKGLHMHRGEAHEESELTTTAAHPFQGE